jgi:hypothetical protein
MDPNRFDDLTRTLANGNSRRQVLKLFVATVVGGLVSTACGSSPDSSGGSTSPGLPGGATSTPDTTSSPSEDSASCPPGTVSCGNTCVNTYSDPYNCGFCGNNCIAAGAVCQSGSCQCGSPALGDMLCDGMCVNTYRNP